MKCLLLALGLWGCSSECYPETRYWNYTDFPTPTSSPTPEDLAIAREVEQCLAPLKSQWLTLEEARASGCVGTPTLEVRECLKIAVPEWHISECTGEQVFVCSVPTASCDAKGQDAGCPCYCRAMIQDNTVVWTTPNRKLLRAYLVTLMTGCYNPWLVPQLLRCVQ